MATFYINKTDAKSHPNIWREIKKNRRFKNARAAYHATYDGRKLDVVGVYPTLKEAENACRTYALNKLHSRSVKIVTG